MPSGFRDTVSRFKFNSTGRGDTWLQFNLSRNGVKDAVTRFKISLIQPVTVWKHTVTRVKVQGRAYINGQTRFRLQVAKFRDTVLRFLLKCSRDTSSRFNILVRLYRDAVIRFKITAPVRDASTRFLLTAKFRNTVTRYILRAFTNRDTSTRFTLQAFNYEQFANNAFSFLVGNLTASAGQTLLTVRSVALFPPRGYFRILIDNEIMLVQEIRGLTFLVSRGMEGTAVTLHNNGANVYHIITAGALQALYSEPLIDSTGAFIYDGATGDILVGRPYP